MKKIKAPISVTLSILLLLSVFALPVSAAYTPEEWNRYWSENADLQKGITMFPGADETQRNFSWYAPAGASACCVDISLNADMSEAVCFEGKTIETYQGDKSAKVTVSGLEKGKTYYYICRAGEQISEIYSFTSTKVSEFSALYVTDIHISESADDAEMLKSNALKFANVLSQANEKRSLSLVLSAGDQASEGLRSEYTGLAAPALLRSLPLAVSIGNHDRKGVDYKYFNNVPNEHYGMINSYIGGDYCFTMGDVLFMVLDSNNAAGTSHRSFMKAAVKNYSEAKWRVVMMHHDLYSKALPHRESENRLLRTLWSPLFDEFNIDLALLGHSHYYSVTDVIYNGKSVAAIENGGTIQNAGGTVYMVSSSLTRPRGDEDLSFGENIAIHVDDTSRTLYNIIDFSKGEISVNTYDYDENELFASFTLSKSDDYKAADISFFRKLVGFMTSFLGTVVAFFNNMGVYSDLKEDGYDIPLFGAFTNLRNTVDAKI